MEMIIAVIVLAVATTVSFMSFVTLSNQIAGVREESRGHWKSLEDSIDSQKNRILSEIQEGKTFNDTAFVALNENITAARMSVLEVIKDTNNQNYEYYNKLSEQIEGHDQDVAEDNETLKVAINDMHRKLSSKINTSVDEINKVTAQQVSRIIYLAPVIDMSAYAKVTGKRHGN